MHLNIVKLKQDINAAATELRQHKTVLRESGQPNVTWKTYAEIAKWKHRATLLCSLRAHGRGRLHRQSVDAAAQAELVAGILTEYALPTEPEAAPVAQRQSTQSNDLNVRGFESRQAHVAVEVIPPKRSIVQKVREVLRI